MDHYTGPVDNGHEWRAAASRWVNDRNGGPTISPWVNTFDYAVEDAYNGIRQDDYNAFLGREGGWANAEESYLNGNTRAYRDDSIAGWFKQAFAGDDMVKHRANAIKGLNDWVGGNGDDLDKGSTRMNKRAFEEMGLAEKYGLEFVDPRQEAYDKMVAGFSSGESTGGFMDAYNSSRPRPSIPILPTTGGPRPMPNRPAPTPDVFPDAPPVDPNYKWSDPFGDRDIGTGVVGHMQPQVKPGGFMESYLKKKAENKPSVMSLMTELKDA
jgi:hypothetical protein